jgi:hypothetical protein
MVEAFFKSIKAELIWRNRWDTCRQSEGAVFQYINGVLSTATALVVRWEKSVGIRTKGRLNDLRGRNATEVGPLVNLTEREVMSAIEVLPVEKALVMNGHRLITVQCCDRLVVMEHGNVVGCGSWDELMAGNFAIQRIAQMNEPKKTVDNVEIKKA